MVIQEIIAIYPSLTLRALFNGCARTNSNWYYIYYCWLDVVIVLNIRCIAFKVIGYLIRIQNAICSLSPIVTFYISSPYIWVI